MHGTTSVRIRHSGFSTSEHLTDWPINDLTGLIRSIREWGVLTDGDYADTEDLFGQFVIDEGAAYFEIVVGGGE